MKRKKLLIPLMAVAFLAGGTAIYAQTASTTTSNPMSSLVTAIAQKFNLNAADVQIVVDETMKAEHAVMEAKRQ